jgi:hypothetical protein
MIEHKQITTLPGLARQLNLPIEWIKAEAKAGRIPCLHVGRKYLFNIDAVLHVLAERAAKGGYNE